MRSEIILCDPSVDLGPYTDHRGTGDAASAQMPGDATAKVLKLYHPGWPREAWANEAEATRRVAELGAPAPRVFGTVEIDGRLGIIMELIEGETVNTALRRSPLRIAALARTLAEVHARVHRITAPDDAGTQLDQLSRKIMSARSPLEPRTKEAAVAVLEAMPRGRAVCHGDLHPLNVIMSPHRGPVIIDWDSPSAGNPWCDIARTYLVSTGGTYHVRGRLERTLVGVAGRIFAKEYLQTYSGVTTHPAPAPGEFATWLWLNAAARLCEGVEPEKERLIAMTHDGLEQGKRPTGRRSDGT